MEQKGREGVSIHSLFELRHRSVLGHQTTWFLGFQFELYHWLSWSPAGRSWDFLASNHQFLYLFSFFLSLSVCVCVCVCVCVYNS